MAKAPPRYLVPINERSDATAYIEFTSHNCWGRWYTADHRLVKEQELGGWSVQRLLRTLQWVEVTERPE